MSKTLKYILCFFSLITACKGTEVKFETITITKNQVKEMISFLTSDELQGRNTGTEGIEKSANYIETKFKEYGIKPYYESYRDSFKVKDLDGYNVVGFLEGNDDQLKDEIVIVGAHYDHIGYGKPVDNDSIANGANDNASGTAGVLAIAKYFAAKKDNKRSIMFALFTAEELGLLGSKNLAKRLKEENANLYTLITFEMIGVPLIDKDYTAFLTGYDMSNMGSKINEYANTTFVGKSEIAVKYSLFKRSDNYPFYQLFDIPAQTISSCDLTNFDYYHHVDDEVDKLDYNFMADLINKTVLAIDTIVNTPTQEIKMNE